MNPMPRRVSSSATPSDFDGDAGSRQDARSTSAAINEGRRMAADCLRRNAKFSMAVSVAAAFACAGAFLSSIVLEPRSFNQQVGLVAGILSTWTVASAAALLSADLYQRRPPRAETREARPDEPEQRGDPQLREIA